ncbi:hypothetical protein FH972_023103 [Carpinus fangiana]|uniref:Uncharacterized protein n=1 Tax=Carpinus fangiana TaxID=176857 RepID=A0A5N6KUJ6_9ROSI|nr:hypothetical protein FH972_023103 [Carpinus fangiana]
MFSQSLSRAARSAPPLLHPPGAAATVPRPCSNHGIAAVSRSTSHARRHSSSKPSAPPGGGHRSAEAPAGGSDAARNPADNERRPASRLARRKSKDSAEQIAAKARDEAFANVPAVPFTHHLKEDGSLSLYAISQANADNSRRRKALFLLRPAPPHLRHFTIPLSIHVRKVVLCHLRQPQDCIYQPHQRYNLHPQQRRRHPRRPALRPTPCPLQHPIFPRGEGSAMGDHPAIIQQR